MRSKTREEQRARTRLAYYAAIALWVIAAAAFLLTADRWRDEPEAETEETATQIEVVAEQLYQIEENDKVEEADEQVETEDPLDLEKLNRIENAKITAYCICKRCCGKDEEHPAYGVTASGRAAEPFVSVAVDPIMIPLGSAVYLDYGDGLLYEFRADDTGGAVVGGHIDVCYPDHESALEHGVKTATVYWKEEWQ